jgi:hypothetical protein
MRAMNLAMIWTAALTVSCCGGGAGTTDTQQIALGVTATTPTTEPAGRPPLGVNLEGLADWARMSPFVDLMKTSRKWGTADAPWDEASAVDALGWPTGDAGVVVKVVTTDEGEAGTPNSVIPPGTYRLKFIGRGTVSHVASPGVTIANAAYDAATNTSTADVVVGSGAYQLILAFRGTSGGVKNVSLRQPSYGESETFTNEFKQAVAPFTTLRFMDFLATNGTPVRTWAERTTPASASQGSSKGGAYEYTIQMANELGKDIWINIPVGADDDHIRQLATLLKDTLAPGRLVYLEYSNELWNWVFPQSGVNMSMAQAEAIAGDTTLTKGTQCTPAMFAAGGEFCDKHWAALYRVGKRTVDISKIFGEVMGSSAFNTRYRPVYATQWAYNAIGEQVLKNMAKYRGAPSSYIYGIAGAPYFNIPADLYNSTTATSTQILDAAQASVENDLNKFFMSGIGGNTPNFQRGVAYDGGDWRNPTQKSLADFYKIKSIAYEGGLDLGQSANSAAAKMAAVKDPRMGDLAGSELVQWFGCGNDVFMYYTLSSAWGQWGYWGLTNDSGNLNSPRYVAAQKIAQTPAANLTTCR